MQRKAIITASAIALLLAGGSAAAMASASQTQIDTPMVYWCYNLSNSRVNYLEFNQPLPHSCLKGFGLIDWPGVPATSAPTVSASASASS